jgi:hypothetical protein
MDERTVPWLFEHGGPTIRYRLANEYQYRPPNTSLDSLKSDLLNDAGVRRWLDNLQSFEYMYQARQNGEGLGEGGHSSFLHGSKNMNLEVVLPKLAQLGLHAGMPLMEKKTASWLKFLQSMLERQFSSDYNDDREFHAKVYGSHDGRMIVAFALAQAGYRDAPPVKMFFDARLDTIYEMVKTGSYNVLEPPGRITIRPKEWDGQVLKLAFYANGEIKLPMVHDVFGFAKIYAHVDSAARKKIERIIEWILTPEHQRLPGNNGFLRYPSGRGKTVGIKTDLPGYAGFSGSAFNPRALILRCQQMAHFKPAQEHPWFRAALKHLESFRTERGTYIFPAEYLEEQARQGKWVEGMRMGLGENRRNPLWRELESTFWMLGIKALMPE